MELDVAYFRIVACKVKCTGPFVPLRYSAKTSIEGALDSDESYTPAWQRCFCLNWPDDRVYVIDRRFTKGVISKDVREGDATYSIGAARLNVHSQSP